ncbi:MAG: hypothetical protein AAF517_13690, partial [Planctomycetota bacterium]
SIFSSGDLEFVEIKNTGPESIPLAGIRLAGAVEFDFANGTIDALEPGGIAVVVSDEAGFAARYGDDPRVAGEYSGNLSNSAEILELRGIADEVIVRIPYSDQWFPQSDGLGPSLRIRDERAERETWSTQEAWIASAEPLGSPGTHDDDGNSGYQLIGDLNQDSALDLSDGISLLRILFGGQGDSLPCGDGTLSSESNRSLADANGDSQVNVSDVVALLNYLFLSGPRGALTEDCVIVDECPDACFGI